MSPLTKPAVAHREGRQRGAVDLVWLLAVIVSAAGVTVRAPGDIADRVVVSAAPLA